MNKTYNLEIDGTTFEVTIEDLESRPIRAIVNGTEVLVTVTEPTAEVSTVADKKIDLMPGDITITSPQILSPLPGKIIDVFVKTGDHVEKGQVILIIEAMKMKNSIRSTRSGTIKTVHIKSGDNVTHKHLMLEFTE